MSAASPLQAELASQLSTASFGRVHEHHAELASTNDRALEWLREDAGGRQAAPHGALVTADRQSAGRGRMGRAWDSAGDDLYASLVLRPGALKHPIGALSLAVGLGLAEAIERACAAMPMQIDVALKWPNDLLVGGKKLGGILCESRWVGEAPDIVVGFGINVARTKFEAELHETATSLARRAEEVGADGDLPSRAALLAAVMVALETRVEAFFSGGFPAIASDYLARCESIGKQIWVPRTQPDGSEKRILATIEGLDDDGALRVRSAAGGPSFRVQSADVWLQGPAGDTQLSC